MKWRPYLYAHQQKDLRNPQTLLYAPTHLPRFLSLYPPRPYHPSHTHPRKDRYPLRCQKNHPVHPKHRELDPNRSRLVETSPDYPHVLAYQTLFLKLIIHSLGVRPRVRVHENAVSDFNERSEERRVGRV